MHLVVFFPEYVLPRALEFEHSNGNIVEFFVRSRGKLVVYINSRVFRKEMCILAVITISMFFLINSNVNASGAYSCDL